MGRYIPLDDATLDSRKDLFNVGDGAGSARPIAADTVRRLREAQAEIKRLEVSISPEAVEELFVKRGNSVTDSNFSKLVDRVEALEKYGCIKSISFCRERLRTLENQMTAIRSAFHNAGNS